MAKYRNVKIKSTSSKIISLSEAVRWKTRGAECHTWQTVKRCNLTHKLCGVPFATKSPQGTSKRGNQIDTICEQLYPVVKNLVGGKLHPVKRTCAKSKKYKSYRIKTVVGVLAIGFYAPSFPPI